MSEAGLEREPLTVALVRQQVAAVEAASCDSQRAHGAEDELYTSVLTAIATGRHEGSPAELAAEALRARDLLFARWYS